MKDSSTPFCMLRILYSPHICTHLSALDRWCSQCHSGGFYLPGNFLLIRLGQPVSTIFEIIASVAVCSLNAFVFRFVQELWLVQVLKLELEFGLWLGLGHQLWQSLKQIHFSSQPRFGTRKKVLGRQRWLALSDCITCQVPIVYKYGC